jgi:2-C-methyl-D-erythritol 4-phosphate cytidylyltransferase
VVVAAAPDCERAAAALAEAGLPAVTVCAGGPTRQESVALGLTACPAGTVVVAVHDAARPLVSPALVDATVAALTPPWAAVAPALAVVDTLKLVDGGSGEVRRTVDRRDLWAVQTPQVFARDTLERAHRAAAAAVTDDLALVEAAGGRVRLVEGERRNFKITFPDDLVVAEALLA